MMAQGQVSLVFHTHDEAGASDASVVWYVMNVYLC